MNQALAFASDLAHQTGELLLRYFDSRGSPVQTKTDASVVTEADLAADQHITQAIGAHYPQDAVLSEELNPTYPNAAPRVWIVDPLDGTTNFSLGSHFWGVSIARLTAGEPELAALYFPVIDELYTARRGGGARLNEEPVQVQPFDPQRPAAFFSCCSRTHRLYDVSVPFKTRILGSAAYSLCTVARGSALLAFEATPKVWDLAGGWLLVQEAGGVIGPLHGASPFPLQPGLEYSRQNFPTLAAASPTLLARAQQQIRPRAK